MLSNSCIKIIEPFELRELVKVLAISCFINSLKIPFFIAKRTKTHSLQHLLAFSHMVYTVPSNFVGVVVQSTFWGTDETSCIVNGLSTLRLADSPLF